MIDETQLGFLLAVILAPFTCHLAFSTTNQSLFIVVNFQKECVIKAVTVIHDTVLKCVCTIRSVYHCNVSPVRNSRRVMCIYKSKILENKGGN